MGLLFRQLFDPPSGSYTYLLADELSHQALLIDPVFERYQRDLALINELDLQLRYSVETHCHADHVSGGWLLRHQLGCAIAASAASGLEGLDCRLNHGDRLELGSLQLEVRATPGHTAGCISLVTADHGMAFTGDCLLIRGCGRTDFQDGCASALFRSITGQLFSLPDRCLVYPGHDYQGRTVSSIGEEKRFNARIGGGANETDFVGYMDAMRLPHPKRLAEAVPANRRLGRPPAGALPQAPEWAPVVMTYSGVWEVSPQWAAGHRDIIRILDVRSDAERAVDGDALADTLWIPLDQLRHRSGEVPQDRPVLTLCRSGRRSAMAFQILRELGWEQVANIQGGLLRWHDEGLPLAPDRCRPASD